MPILIYLSIPLGATAQSLEAISGPTHGKSGDTLTFVVEARDSDGNPQSGVAVLFSYRAPDSYTPSVPNDDTSNDDAIDMTELGIYRTTTGAGGRAQTTLILRDDAASSYQILAWRTDDASLTTDFTVTVDIAPPPRSTITTPTGPLPVPTTFEGISGDDQTGLPGTVLADPFVVEVRDQNGEPLEGVTVTFAVVRGGGAVSVAASLTDSDGRVESVLTLGTDPGTNKIQVSVESISQRVVFSAEGTTTPSEPMPDEDEETTPPITEPMPTSLTFDLALPSGLNLIHIPLTVRAVNGTSAGIESVSDLYDALGGADTVDWLITHDSVTQEWHGYFGDGDRGSIADRALTDQTGVLASTKTSISIHLAGDALGIDGRGTITLNPGLNLVGLPLNDPKITSVSDLLTDNVHVVVVTEDGEFKLVGSAGDPGDIPVTGGQGFILIAQQGATVPIAGTGWNNVP